MNDYLRFRGGFAAAIDGSLYTIEYLDWLMAEGRAEIRASDNAAIIYQLRSYPGGALAVHGIIAAGDLEEIIALIPQAEAWGKANGATLAIIESRAGWARALRKRGYEPHQVAVRKEL